MSSPATGTDETIGRASAHVSAEEWEAAQAGRSRGLAHTCRTMLQARSQTKVGDRLTRRSAPAMRRVSGAGVPAEAAPARRRLCCERSHASFRAWSGARRGWWERM